jgi:citrate/tricarballylate utilization protein
MTICNACRYCEGYCAVFPAMERRTVFTPEDVKHLANLCHNCAECFYACQYAPPHEFAVNVPQTFAQVRLVTYEERAWPRPLWRWLNGRGLWAAAFLAAAVVAGGLATGGGGSGFYAAISHRAMVSIFSVTGLFAGLALAMSLLQTGLRITGPAVLRGLRAALTLRNLSSGGKGCTYPSERHSNARRWFHHLTFYGFLLCFASTTAAAAYHYLLGREGPHPYTSLPVVLGTLGGIGLLAGPAGLFWLKLRREPDVVDESQDSMDLRFLTSLFLISLTGFALMLLRDGPWLRPLLLVHLVLVLGFFLTLPYGKFVHGLHRAAALIRDAGEKPDAGAGPANPI